MQLDFKIFGLGRPLYQISNFFPTISSKFNGFYINMNLQDNGVVETIFPALSSSHEFPNLDSFGDVPRALHLSKQAGTCISCEDPSVHKE